MAGGPTSDAAYSAQIGYLLVCNLIVGTGALALPKAFHSAGYILSIALLLLSAFTSYVAATFIIEAMAIANAEKHKLQLRKETEKSKAQLRDAYDIKDRVEVSSMAKLFLGKYGVMFLSFIMTVYLFGDLAIYTTTVPKSLMNVICGSVNVSSVKVDDPCYENWPHWLNRMAVYRFAVCGFTLFVTPLVVIGVTRTKYLQLATSCCRWSAFIIMIVLSSIQFGKDGANIPKAADLHGFGSLFGTTVYAFMCHHSLPSLVAPMKSKRRISFYLLLVYIVVFVFYLVVSVTGVLAFKVVFDVYPLNFLHSENTTIVYQIINYFLALFPVFTLTSNYPIVANTLINNFLVLIDIVQELWLNKVNFPFFKATVQANSENIMKVDLSHVPEDSPEPQVKNHKNLLRYVIMTVIICIATTIALCTENVLTLSTVTGSYPGVGVQYVIPALLVMFGRRYSANQLRTAVPGSVRSPFSQSFWPYLMFAWSVISVVMTTLNLCNVFK